MKNVHGILLEGLKEEIKCNLEQLLIDTDFIREKVQDLLLNIDIIKTVEDSKEMERYFSMVNTFTIQI